MEKINWRKTINNFSLLDKVLIVLGLFGTVILVVSLFRGIRMNSQVQVEYVKGASNVNQEVSQEKIYVDVSGEVMKPGVYELVDNSRIKDALAAAGGLSAKADREYVASSINLAEKIRDGQKIYFPKIGLTPSGGGYVEAKSGGKKININTASLSELDTLVGIGEKRAGDIVNGRPFQKVDDLVSKGILTKTVLDKIKDNLVTY